MTYNFIKKYPYILKYTSKPVVAVKEGTPYEEAFETYNYSIPGADYDLKGVDGSKTGSSPEGAFNYIDTIKRGDQRMIAVIMGSPSSMAATTLSIAMVPRISSTSGISVCISSL